MKILHTMRSNVTDANIESIGASVFTRNLGNYMLDLGVHIQYASNCSPSVMKGQCFPLFDGHHAASKNTQEAINIYRNEFDILHIHLYGFSTLDHLVKYSNPSDKIVVTIHLAGDAGRSVYTSKDALIEILKRPNIKLVAVSESGVRVPLLKMAGLLDTEDKDKLMRVIHNGVLSYADVYEGVNSDLDWLLGSSAPKNDRVVIIGRFDKSKNILPSSGILHDLQSQCNLNR